MKLSLPLCGVLMLSPLTMGADRSYPPPNPPFDVLQSCAPNFICFTAQECRFRRECQIYTADWTRIFCRTTRWPYSCYVLLPGAEEESPVS
ncbi:no significant blast hit [Histoplasma capsulatum var. duboisii H88]|uniref:No significant blast hit n=1 Tax=Ajellomyces capsulatus (strain H88) TaxID=544711 RepID=A0A8A1LKL0_AJEC8|nr:no significant blast hit [Histoplasma capsulatum var. duboisii H88]